MLSVVQKSKVVCVRISKDRNVPPSSICIGQVCELVLYIDHAVLSKHAGFKRQTWSRFVGQGKEGQRVFYPIGLNLYVIEEERVWKNALVVCYDCSNILCCMNCGVIWSWWKRFKTHSEEERPRGRVWETFRCVLTCSLERRVLWIWNISCCLKGEEKFHALCICTSRVKL